MIDIILFEYDFARQVCDYRMFCIWFRSTLKGKIFAVFTICAWLIYFARNQLRHESTFTDEKSITLKAISFFWEVPKNDQMPFHKFFVAFYGAVFMNMEAPDFQDY